MNFEALKNNLIDVLKESQIKLGYTENSVGIYYPPEALCNLLGEKLTVDEIKQALEEFSSFSYDTFFGTEYSYLENENRFCVNIPQQGVKNVHENIPEPQFLKAFISKIYEGASTIDQLLEVFKSFSDHVVCQEIESDEFQYLVYFQDGKPDDYRYCIDIDLGHASYHRFTPADYDDLGI